MAVVALVICSLMVFEVTADVGAVAGVLGEEGMVADAEGLRAPLGDPRTVEGYRRQGRRAVVEDDDPHDCAGLVDGCQGQGDIAGDHGRIRRDTQHQRRLLLDDLGVGWRVLAALFASPE